MFCSSCGTPNPDEATKCRVCGEQLFRPVHKSAEPGSPKSPPSKTWLWAMVIAIIVWIGAAFYTFGPNHKFEVTVELLYNNKTGLHPAAGASVRVYEDKGKEISPKSRYALILLRQAGLKIGHEIYQSIDHADLSPLNLPPLSRMDSLWWEFERKHNCSWAAKLFNETLQFPKLVASNSTDTNGHFWLKLKRGTYYITAESEVQTYWHSNDSLHTVDTSQPTTGTAFWMIPTEITGVKVISAEPDCSPD